MERIEFGHAGPQVEDVQRRLTALGLHADDDAGTFGPGTLEAVRAFQQDRGLAADGVVGDDTWHALVGASYRLGDRVLYPTQPPLHGDDIRELQRRLNRLGFDCGFDDGVYGEQTTSAVREFQLNTGTLVDGIAGPQTFGLLARLHRRHQESPVFLAHERDQLRHPPRRSLAGARMMIDPAHSAQDPGLTAPCGTPEHEITWSIATLVEGRLAALGAHVVLSRGPRSSPTPSERARHANDEGVEVILSVHLNADRSPSARGVAGYHFGTDAHLSERGRALAQFAVDRVADAIETANCRVHPSTAALLRESRAPAAVIETGFVTHPDEGRVLIDPAGQRLVADALVDALACFMMGVQPAAHGSSVPA